MNRLRLTTVSATLLATSVLFTGNGSGRFDTKLSKDQQILQALNRLTFGPRPGDVDEVRRMGVDKWVDLQLHPDRIPENPVLEAKLRPLETLRMAPAEILKEYPLAIPGLNQIVRVTDLLPGDQLRKLNSGTVEERLAVLKPLEPDKRQQVLGALDGLLFASAILIAALGDVAINAGIESIIANFDSAMLRLYRRLGCEVEVLGSTSRYGRLVYLGLFPVSTPILCRIKERMKSGDPSFVKGRGMADPQFLKFAVVS